MSRIKIQNLHKSFGKKKVLDDINLEVGEKEIFGFVGLNGAGKTTTIKILLKSFKARSGQC